MAVIFFSFNLPLFDFLCSPGIFSHPLWTQQIWSHSSSCRRFQLEGQANLLSLSLGHRKNSITSNQAFRRVSLRRKYYRYKDHSYLHTLYHPAAFLLLCHRGSNLWPLSFSASVCRFSIFLVLWTSFLTPFRISRFGFTVLTAIINHPEEKG